MQPESRVRKFKLHPGRNSPPTRRERRAVCQRKWSEALNVTENDILWYPEEVVSAIESTVNRMLESLRVISRRF